MKVKRKTEQYIYVDIDITGATLLSIGEARQLPIELRKYPCWYWLRSHGGNSDRAASVRGDGSVNDYGDFVNFVNDAVRPALKISNFNSSNLHIGDIFTFGGKPFEIISYNLAFCLTDIGIHCFRKNVYAAYANDYEKSDIKKYVDDWFKDSKESADTIIE